MATQDRSRRKCSSSKGKEAITQMEMEMALIVDRYFVDNNFSETRAAFREEAVSLISGAGVAEKIKQYGDNLMSLKMILNDHASLKKIESVISSYALRVEREEKKIQEFLLGIQASIKSFNAGSASTSTAPVAPVAAAATTATAMRPASGAFAASSSSPVAGDPVFASPAIIPAGLPPTGAHGNKQSSVLNVNPATEQRGIAGRASLVCRSSLRNQNPSLLGQRGRQSNMSRSSLANAKKPPRPPASSTAVPDAPRQQAVASICRPARTGDSSDACGSAPGMMTQQNPANCIKIPSANTMDGPIIGVPDGLSHFDDLNQYDIFGDPSLSQYSFEPDFFATC